MLDERLVGGADNADAAVDHNFAGSDLRLNTADTYSEALAFDQEFDAALTTLSEHGVADMAREQMVVHGRRMSVVYGMAACKPFKESLEDTVVTLAENGITDRGAIELSVRRHLKRQVDRAPAVLPGDVEKKSAA